MFDNIIYNYIVIGMIAIIAFKISWNIVGKLYDWEIITGKVIGSIFHWFIRFMAFVLIFYFCSMLLWITKFISIYRNIILMILGILLVFILFILIQKLINNKKIFNKLIIFKPKTMKKIQKVNDIANIGVGILSSVNPEFSIMPIFIYAINRTLGLASPEYIKERLNKFSEKLEKKEVHMEQFKIEIAKLSEHDEYIVLNHLRNILLTCIPEMLDIYIEVIIDFIMKKECREKEEICEIVNQLNVNDLKLLNMIKEFLDKGEKEFYNKNQISVKQREQEFKENDEYNKDKKHIFKKINFVDRNIVIDDKKTIFWRDFEKYYELQSVEMGFILLFKTIDENGKESCEWAHIGKSFVKLQNLGILELEYVNTVGNISSLNIDRFHITLFGKDLLSYIKINSDYIERSIIC